MENFAQNYVKLDIFGQKGGKSKISGGSRGPSCADFPENADATPKGVDFANF